MTEEKIYEESLRQLRARAWTISNSLLSESNKLKNNIEESQTDKKFLNINCLSDRVNTLGEQLNIIGELSIAIWRRENGYNSY